MKFDNTIGSNNEEQEEIEENPESASFNKKSSENNKNNPGYEVCEKEKTSEGSQDEQGRVEIETNTGPENTDAPEKDDTIFVPKNVKKKRKDQEKTQRIVTFVSCRLKIHFD